MALSHVNSYQQNNCLCNRPNNVCLHINVVFKPYVTLSEIRLLLLLLLLLYRAVASIFACGVRPLPSPPLLYSLLPFSGSLASLPPLPFDRLPPFAYPLTSSSRPSPPNPARDLGTAMFIIISVNISSLLEQIHDDDGDELFKYGTAFVILLQKVMASIALK